uniref:Uncharacterized protein n=1 Tax=Anguilla anguilla TaxID=7936 RepID=A0A0E9RMN0_ANGAN
MAYLIHLCILLEPIS